MAHVKDLGPSKGLAKPPRASGPYLVSTSQHVPAATPQGLLPASNTNQGLHLKHTFILLFSSNSFFLCFLKVKYVTDWKFTKLVLPLRTFETCVLIPPLSRCSRWKPSLSPMGCSRGLWWVEQSVGWELNSVSSPA